MSELPPYFSRKLPIDYQESSKWVELVEWVSVMTPDTFKGKRIHVADREADFFERLISK